MYKIGETSKITKISTRMLRYYDKENILKPSCIKDNGYRYYTDKDISIISKIKILRRYDFTYEEIKIILDNNKYEDKHIYINKIKELTHNMNKYGDLISEIEEEKDIKNKNIIINNYDINFCEKQSVQTLCKRVLINYDEIDKFIESCYSVVSQKRITKLGYYYIMFYDNENLDENICDIEYYQHIVNNEEINNFDTKTIEEATYISTIHYGTYSKISKAYAALYKWTENNEFKIKGNFIEKYFIDSSISSYSVDFITEVSIKVCKA